MLDVASVSFFFFLLLFFFFFGCFVITVVFVTCISFNVVVCLFFFCFYFSCTVSTFFFFLFQKKKKTAFCSLLLLVLPLRYRFNALLPLYRTSYTTCVFLRPALVSLLSYSAFLAFSPLLFSCVFICCVWRKSVHAQGEGGGGHIQKGVSQHQRKDKFKKEGDGTYLSTQDSIRCDFWFVSLTESFGHSTLFFLSIAVVSVSRRGSRREKTQKKKNTTDSSLLRHQAHMRKKTKRSSENRSKPHSFEERKKRQSPSFFFCCCCCF